MVAIALDPSLTLERSCCQEPHQQQGVVIEEIDGLIRAYKDGQVERPQIVPCVTTALAPEFFGVTSKDVVIDKVTNIWARFYVPHYCHQGRRRLELLPLLVYFHGGGFCVGSAAWICYHEFLAKLSMKANCLIMSVNYRLAPENPLPAAYDDGFKALVWLKQQALLGGASDDQYWWSRKCNFSSIFLAGDSAGANIAHNVAATRLGSNNNNNNAYDEATNLKPLVLKGTILIQPFFGGEVRTQSEKYMVQPPRSALTLAASDTYWRLSLPRGANRDHPWCNPMSKKGSINKFEELRRILPSTMVCVSEMDILRDRNMEFCDALDSAGMRVECVVYKGVGHAFQILNRSQLSQNRTNEMISHIKAFIGGR